MNSILRTKNRVGRGNHSSRYFTISLNGLPCVSGSRLRSHHRPPPAFAPKLSQTTTVSVSQSHGCGCIRSRRECPYRPTHWRVLPNEKGVPIIRSFGCSTGNRSNSVSTANLEKAVCEAIANSSEAQAIQSRSKKSSTLVFGHTEGIEVISANFKRRSRP
jgi:hypothetical protein